MIKLLGLQTSKSTLSLKVNRSSVDSSVNRGEREKSFVARLVCQIKERVSNARATFANRERNHSPYIGVVWKEKCVDDLWGLFGF